MSKVTKRVKVVGQVLLLGAFLSSTFAFAGYDKPGKARGYGRGHGGAPEIALSVLVATGLVSTGLLYAKRRRDRKD